MSKQQVLRSDQHLISVSRRNTIIVILFATVVGALIRCFYVFQSDFPLNDGGMFYTMIKDLQAAHYCLPAFTTYNQASIPFAYPPLGFYLAGFLNTLFHIDLIQLLRFIPLVFSILTIPAFYFLTSQLLKKETQRAIAVFTFALLSSTYDWEIMGGGLTRSIALFFTILALAAYLKWTKSHKWINYFTFILFTSLAALSHLEMAWMLLLSYVVFFIFFQHTWKELGLVLASAAGVLLLTAPWWVDVVSLHGILPFQQALHNSNFSILGTLARLLLVNPGQDLVQTLFSLIAFIGIFITVRERNWYLPMWWLVFTLIDPRSDLRSSSIPIALLSGICLDIWFSWVSQHLHWGKKASEKPRLAEIDFSNNWIKLILAGSIFFFIFNDLVGYYSSGNLLVSVNAANRQAMTWVKENTPSDSQFLVIDFPSAWHSDMVAEWFPTLTGRVSILTAQGKEWLPGDAQGNAILELTTISECRMNGLSCLQSFVQTDNIKFDYVYFTENTQPIAESPQYTSVIELQITADPGYQLVFANSDVKIYQKK